MRQAYNYRRVVRWNNSTAASELRGDTDQETIADERQAVGGWRLDASINPASA
jgi:hypothetical protein